MGKFHERAPSKAFRDLKSRLPREELSGRSNIILTRILSLNHTYIVTSLQGISYLPNWIKDCWGVNRALHFLWDKLRDKAQSNKVRSCLIEQMNQHSILEQNEFSGLFLPACFSIGYWAKQARKKRLVKSSSPMSLFPWAGPEGS